MLVWIPSPLRRFPTLHCSVMARTCCCVDTQPEDADGIWEQCQDPDMARFTTIPVPYGRSDVDWFLNHVATGSAEGNLAAFAIEVAGTFAGTADLRLQAGRWAEVGFGLPPWARGRGVMTRALHLLLEWGFTELALDGIQWRAIVGNEGSWRVAQKSGSRWRAAFGGCWCIAGSGWTAGLEPCWQQIDDPRPWVQRSLRRAAPRPTEDRCRSPIVNRRTPAVSEGQLSAAHCCEQADSW